MIFSTANQLESLSLCIGLNQICCWFIHILWFALSSSEQFMNTILFYGPYTFMNTYLCFTLILWTKYSLCGGVIFIQICLWKLSRLKNMWIKGNEEFRHIYFWGPGNFIIFFLTAGGNTLPYVLSGGFQISFWVYNWLVLN